jgi:hypothetical protein
LRATFVNSASNGGAIFSRHEGQMWRVTNLVTSIGHMAQDGAAALGAFDLSFSAHGCAPVWCGFQKDQNPIMGLLGKT